MFHIYIYTRSALRKDRSRFPFSLSSLFPRNFTFYRDTYSIALFKQITGTRSRVWNRNGDSADIRMESITLVLTIETRELLKYHEAALRVYVYTLKLR